MSENSSSLEDDATRLQSVANPKRLAIGDVISKLELLEVLGEGGMGTVYKAKNRVWEKVGARDPYLAIKVLHPELSADEQLIGLLYSEFKRQTTLANCPNIVKVHDFDNDGGHFYIKMEYIDGIALNKWIYAQPKPMSLSQVWFIIEAIGNALAYAHQLNIVHRDIKPGNVMITKDNGVKVLDFGIAAKINEKEGDKTRFSGAELSAYSVAYSSPEMLDGEPPDKRDDVYSFACVIYELLAGKRFYERKDLQAKVIPGLNARQTEALYKALALKREQRTDNVKELVDKLRPVKSASLKYLLLLGVLFALIGLAGYQAANISNWISGFLGSKPAKESKPSELVTETASAPVPATATATATATANANAKPSYPGAAKSVAPVEQWQTIDRYQVNGGLVKDTVTGLMWMRCSIGQIWDGSTCAGQVESYQWQQAMDLTRNFSYGAYKDWRAPTVQELKSLVYCSSGLPSAWNQSLDQKCEGQYLRPAILSAVFPNIADVYWSSSAYAGNYAAWNVSFGNGSVDWYYKTNSYAVLLVRSGQ